MSDRSSIEWTAFDAEVFRVLPRVQAWFNALDRATDRGELPPAWPWPEAHLLLVAGVPQTVAFLVELHDRYCPNADIDAFKERLKVILAEAEDETQPSRTGTSDRWQMWGR